MQLLRIVLVEINPKINDKFASYPGIPDSFRKLIKKLLEAQIALNKKNSTSPEVIASFNKILKEVVDDPEIKKYIDDKTNGGKNL